MCPKILVESFEVCTPLGEFNIVKRVYRCYPMSILYKVVSCDLVDLFMVDFDIMLGIE